MTPLYQLGDLQLTHFVLTCFPGEVLSVERSVAVVRGGARGDPPGVRVRVLPLDTQCIVKCTPRVSLVS